MFKVSLCFFIMLVFASCGNHEFYNLSSFTDKYSKASDTSMDISDFYFSDLNKAQYTAVLGSNSNEVLLTLKCDLSNNIEEVDISIIKESGKSPTISQGELFRNTLINTLITYCNYDDFSAKDILTSFNLTDDSTLLKEGELTLKKGHFYFVYYSTSQISQVKIYNTYLHKIETTEKPVSKPYYAEDFIVKEKETP